jgi:hypothetical protein
MSSIKTKIVGLSIIVACIMALSLILILVSFEVTGLSKKISAHDQLKANMLPGDLLVSSDYYGNKLKADPYKKFTVQKLHPYYLFSLPWKENDIQNANNNIVSINNSGFRVNPFDTSNINAVLLGGSTAFGHFSSSDKETLAYHISQKMNVNIINRNAPSWNSHQELVALAKMPPIYKFSISLSLANDIALSCVNYIGDNTDRLPDQPESFDVLASYFDDLRGGIIDLSENIGFIRKFKNKLMYFFPDTYYLANLVKQKLFKKNSDTITTDRIAYCDNYSAELIANSFLKNQEVMSRISKSIGATHYLVLQPQIEISNKEYHKLNEQDGSEINTRRSIYASKVYEIVMQSEYCKSNPCLDLTKADLSKFGKKILYSAKNLDTSALFADNSHFLDSGVRFYSSLIADFISLNR